MAKCTQCGTTVANYFVDRPCPKCGARIEVAMDNDNLTLDSNDSRVIEQTIESFPIDPDTAATATIDLSYTDIGLTTNVSESDSTVSEVPSHLKTVVPKDLTVDDQTEGIQNQDSTGSYDQTIDSSDSSIVNSWLSTDSKTLDSSVGNATTSDITLDSSMSVPDRSQATDSGVSGSSISEVTLDISSLPSMTGNPTVDSTDSSNSVISSSDATLDASIDTKTLQNSFSVPTDSDEKRRPSGDSSSLYKSAEVRQIWENAAGSINQHAQSLQRLPRDKRDELTQRIALRQLNLNPNFALSDADYNLKFELGRGKQGVVYAAEQTALGRTVAIKLVIKGSGGQGERSKLERFVKEAEITATLDHPNILPIHELAITNRGEFFYSMKKVDGKAWDEILKENSNTLAENIDCLLKVCDALAFAHSKGIIHRDLKPGNIMIGGFGEVLVADWGLAVDLNKVHKFQPNASQRDPFSFGGTPAYMSPEMAKHDWPKIGIASDIYLLGAILYHLIEGKPPRDGKTIFEVLDRAKNNFYLPVADEGGLMAVALKAMSASPKDRYATAIEFQEAIREVNRHSESMRLCEHASIILTKATQDSDYEKFNEAIFKFRNALDLWSGNDEAIAGLKRARLAYAQKALERGDNDVCLQTLDPNLPDEAELYRKAEKAQAESRLREKRYRNLRRYSAIGAIVALTGLSTLSVWLGYSFDQVKQQAIALEESNTKIKKQNEDITSQSAQILAQSEEIKTKNKTLEDSNSKIALQNQEINQQLTVIKEQNQEISQTNMDLEISVEKEKAARAEAVRKTVEALRNERVATLGSFQARMLSAFNLAQANNVRRSNVLLQEITEQESGLRKATGGNVNELLAGNNLPFISLSPSLRTWAFERVSTLINRDVPQYEMLAPLSCLAIASEKQQAIVGTASGAESFIQRVDFSENVIKSIGQKISIDRDIVGVAITPDGREAVVLCSSSGEPRPTLYWVDLESSQSQPFSQMENRSFSSIAFSPDGRRFIAGCNEGIYVWERDGRLDPTQKEKLRFQGKGELGDIHFVGDEKADYVSCVSTVYLSDGSKELFVYECDLQSGETVGLRFDESMARLASAAVPITKDGNYLVGTRDGRLLLGEKTLLNSGEQILKINGEIQQNQSQSLVRHIRPMSDGRVLVVTLDSNVHIWKGTEKSGERTWEYEQTLRGLTESVVDGFRLNQEEVIAGDRAGRLIRWNLSEQSKRALVSMPPAQEALIATGGEGNGESGWWVDKNGVVCRWSENADGARDGKLSYPGHTPGAEFADADFSEQANRLVTICRLGEFVATERRSDDPLQEICVWELNSGEMLSRWTRVGKNVPRLKLIEDGTRLVIADESRLIVVSLDGREEYACQDEQVDITAVDIACHPFDKSIVAVVDGRGKVWVVDARNTPRVVAKDDSLAFGNNFARTIGVAWNADGKRVYVLRNTSFENDVALVAWDLEANQLTPSPKYFDRLEKLAVSDSKIQRDKHICDIKVTKDSQGQDQVDIVVRYGYRSQATGDLMAALGVRVHPNSTNVLPAEISEFPNPVWLNEELDRVPVTAKQVLDNSSVEQPCKVLKIAKDSGLAVLNVGRNSAAGVVHFLPVRYLNADSVVKSTSLGRTECIDADSDSANKNWVTLHRHGEIWFATASDESEATWKRWPSEFLFDEGLEKPQWVKLSSSGSQVLVGGKGKAGSLVLLCDVAKLQVLKAWQDCELAAWHPDGSKLARINSDDAVMVADLGNLDQGMTIGNLQGLRGDKKLTSMSWFKESLSNDQKNEDHWYLLVGLGEQELVFVPSQSQPKDAAPLNFEVLKMESPITAVACSPRDATLVVGTRDGSMTTWFASPTVDVRPRELFSIDRHRGSAITDLRFSKDGRALYSADSGAAQQANVAGASEKTGRAFGWLATGVQ